MRARTSKGIELNVLEEHRIALVEFRDDNLNHFTVQSLLPELEKLMQQEDRPFDSMVLSCRRVHIMDSSGASMVIRLHRIAAQESICLVICELRDQVVKSLQALNLGFAVARYDTSTEALDAMK